MKIISKKKLTKGSAQHNPYNLDPAKGITIKV